MKQVKLLMKQNGINTYIILSPEEYKNLKFNLLCSKCNNKKPGLCPPVSTPTSLKISDFTFIIDAYKLYRDREKPIILSIDKCLKYKEVLVINEENEKNKERIAKGAAVFTEEEEKRLRLIYRRYKGNR